jgi:hypothetical protein
MEKRNNNLLIFTILLTLGVFLISQDNFLTGEQTRKTNKLDYNGCWVTDDSEIRCDNFKCKKALKASSQVIEKVYYTDDEKCLEHARTLCTLAEQQALGNGDAFCAKSCGTLFNELYKIVVPECYVSGNSFTGQFIRKEREKFYYPACNADLYGKCEDSGIKKTESSR